MIKITSNDGDVTISIDASNSSKIFAEFGCIVLAFIKSMNEEGVKHAPERVFNMAKLAVRVFKES